MRKYKKYLNKTDTESLSEDWKNIQEDLWKALGSMKPKINKLDISNVESEDLDRNEPILQFQDYDDVIENICNVIDLDDGITKMKKIFKDSNFEKHYYSRIIEYDGYYKIDYGSHNCFFRVTKGDL